MVHNAAERNQEKIVLYLSPNQPFPTLPFEFQGHISPDDWAVRIPAITALASQYYKPLFERVYTIVAFMAVVILPIALYQVLFRTVDVDNDPFDREGSNFFQARTISMGVFIAALVFFALPMVMWKSIGKRRMNAMLRRWAQADRAVKGPAGYIPVWTVSGPTVFKSRTILAITIPPNAPPTIFHPDAYLPSYINGPRDQGAAYYYPYAPGQPGLPRMSTVGDLPAYTNYDMKLPVDEKV